jgi:UDPglucose 6-dehydrogenase
LKETLSFIGLGKLGLCMAACLAVKGGYKVIGIDVNENVVNSFKKGVAPIVEPRLQEYINKAGKNLIATTSYQEAIAKTDITFIMVATPSKPDGSFSNEYVEASLKSLSELLKKSNKKYHLFVISSTVMPGSIEASFIPLIERFSERKLNIGFGVCYTPDLVALGNVIHDYLNPDMVILGQSDQFAGDQVATIHRRTCENNPPIFQMSLVNAEIAKVAVNCYITTKISFANALSNICERTPGANIDEITNAVGTDRRISPLYFKGGLSYGGTCFPRDTVAYLAIAKKCGLEGELISAVEKINKRQDQLLVERTLEYALATPDKKVSVLGLAFKPNTPVITESPGIKLIESLVEKGLEIVVYDPLAIENTRAVFQDRITYAKSVRDCIAKSSVCVITTPDKEYKNIDDSYLTNECTVIIDCWRILDSGKFIKRIKYVAFGKGPQEDT